MISTFPLYDPQQLTNKRLLWITAPESVPPRIGTSNCSTATILPRIPDTGPPNFPRPVTEWEVFNRIFIGSHWDVPGPPRWLGRWVSLFCLFGGICDRSLKQTTLCKLPLADWKIPNFNRKYIFIPGLCSIATVDGRNPANHLGCIKPCKYSDKLPSSTGAGFVPPTVFTSQMRSESREYLP